MAFRSLLVLALAAVLVACDGAPRGAPDLTGTITRSSASVSVASILVEERPADAAGSAKASVRVTGTTSLWKTVDGRQEAALVGDLREGARVQVWFDGPVAMSYPVQGTAKAIVILTP